MAEQWFLMSDEGEYVPCDAHGKPLAEKSEKTAGQKIAEKFYSYTPPEEIEDDVAELIDGLCCDSSVIGEPATPAIKQQLRDALNKLIDERIAATIATASDLLHRQLNTRIYPQSMLE